jgi:NAD(P)H-flavin reductase/ferredoxin
MFFGLFKKKPKGPAFVRVEPLGVDVEVPPNQSLLQAVLEAGYDFPHSCKVGTCMSCRCRLISGKVNAIRDFSYVLSGEELRAGYILACQAKVPAGTQVVVEMEVDANRPQFETITATGHIVAQQPLTHDIVELKVDLIPTSQPMRYAAGQYASLRREGLDRDREYSFAAAPSADGVHQLTFFIRHVPGGAFTDWLFAESRIGSPLQVSGPGGDFWLRPDDSPLVFIAGGSGLAPILSILENAVQTGCKRDVTFLFGARAQRDLYKCDVIEAIGKQWQGAFSFIPVLSDEPADSNWQGKRGLVTEYLTSEHVNQLGACHAYLCGPPRMIDSAMTQLYAAGIPEAHIHYDKFLDASSLKA